MRGSANDRFVSVAVMGAWNGKAKLLVATDQQGQTRNVLQLALDEFLILQGNWPWIFHNKRMRGGVKSASKVAMIDWLPNEAPHRLHADGSIDVGVLPVGRRQN